MPDWSEATNEEMTFTGLGPQEKTDGMFKIVQRESMYKEVFTKSWVEASTVSPGGSSSWIVTISRSKEARDWRSHQSSKGEQVLQCHYLAGNSALQSRDKDSPR